VPAASPRPTPPLRTTLVALAGACVATFAAGTGVAESWVPAAPSARVAARRGGDVAAIVDGGDDAPRRGESAVGLLVPSADGDALRRRRLSDGAVGTYVGEILLERDSALSRWPAHRATPLTVWVQPWAAVTGWDDAFAQRARGAFVEWERTGIPVRFAFTDDSAAADVHVVWTDHFDEPISGKTLWTRDERWWITGASITLALHHQDGEPLDAGAVRAIALHEVGHLLGLDHTSDPGNVMTPRVRVRDLSAVDRATVRLLYSLPPGRVR
jgi:hypothetical protein